MDIPNRIKSLIEKHKISSINELGRIANIPQSTLATIMLGKTSPRADTIEQICNGLGITLAEFFTEESSSVPAQSVEDVSPEDLALARELKNLPDTDRKEVQSFIQFKKQTRENANDDDQAATMGE
ncbi:transcriptional regulator with XRE-family HTH domain [Sporomusaceae bacterium BoRhaA]|uniref:helix-turn-helix domain-containing protein n=1 Tax=Pelorhabdus rhamnosifermentans TaxID=2772457 RepID=UPI001C0624CC|nr:helix-turn-helix transcriptional regulator [Pelorhabdus rhamnosifermentans]MBU2701655.1 transcriptional regulator with XRE-family HTH domain [Pelorhabdus rhamnosifermentans]